MYRSQLLRQSRAVSCSFSRVSTARQISSPFSSFTLPTSTRALPALQQHAPRRWQSTETEKRPEDEKPADAETKPAESSSENALKEELEKSKREVIDLKDKYLRSVADYRNLQDRNQRDNAAARNFAIQRFATDLLDSIDNLDRALSAVPKSALGQADSSPGVNSTTSNTSSADANKAAASETVQAPNKDLLNLHSGLKMTEEILMNTLKKHGLERFDPMEGEGRKFDPNQDEATFFTKVEGKEDGEVFFTQSKGFTLNGRVIRAAKVGVVKNS